MPAPVPKIVLMGLRGSGKSTVGRLLADRLGDAFLDLDDATAARLGSSDPAGAISRLGMDRFRLAEADALREALAGDARVIALGGGTPTAPGAADVLRRSTRDGSIVVLYLHADVGSLRTRLASTDTATRPSLTGRGTLDEIGPVYLERDPLYRSLATRVIETEGRSPGLVADEIVDTP
jgi:shikimate kinase